MFNGQPSSLQPVVIRKLLMQMILMKQKTRVIAGPSKKDKTVSEDRQIVAYHEAGHTIVGLVLSNASVSSIK